MMTPIIGRNKRHLDNQRLTAECKDNWCWNKYEKSHEVRLSGPNLTTAHFHPQWSNGTAGVRGTRILNRSCSKFYWEIKVSERVFGTSMMFGISTKKSRLHADSFVNMLGEDEHGWGLSHKGLLWHDGQWKIYTKPFRENEATTIGILFDNRLGTLSYFKDGVSLGVAFTGLDQVEEELFPTICSTAAKTEMRICNMRREYWNLQDRCREVIRKRVKSEKDIQKLHLPKPIKEFLIYENDTFTKSITREASLANFSSGLPPHHCHAHSLGNFTFIRKLQALPPFLEL